MKRRSPRTGPRAALRSHGRVRRATLCFVLLASLVAAAPAQAEASGFAHRSAQVFDLIIVRPLRFGRMLFGFALFVPAAHFTENETVPEAFDLFVGEPFRATFLTPLGELEEEY